MTKRRPKSAGCVVPFKGYAMAKPRDAPDDGPCGQPVVMSVGGVDVSADQLCVAHFQLRHGAAALRDPVEVAP